MLTKLNKPILYILAVILFPLFSFANELQIPFECYPERIKKAFNDAGIELEISREVRKETTWGFIDNRGSNYSIFTYKPTTREELELINKIITEMQ